jgi:hypothetical protein
MSKLLDQRVDHVSVQLPDPFREYQKKMYIKKYNCMAELIRNKTNITPKHIYFN